MMRYHPRARAQSFVPAVALPKHVALSIDTENGRGENTPAFQVSKNSTPFAGTNVL
jgi:hypothetical protein